MIAALIIVFREGFEAFLTVAIIVTYLALSVVIGTWVSRRASRDTLFVWALAG